MISRALVTTLLLSILIYPSIGQATNKVIACSSDESQCGSKCYLVETHKCKSGFVCRKEEGWCGDKCFNPTTHKCIWGLICLKSEVWCNQKCFNPAIQQCGQSKLINIITKNV